MILAVLMINRLRIIHRKYLDHSLNRNSTKQPLNEIKNLRYFQITLSDNL